MSQDDRTRDLAWRKAHATSFGGVADAYHRARPSYPPEAVGWLVGNSPVSVVELGAGTGKLTRLLVEAGHDVLAVDPSVEMLAHLQAGVPGARTAVATAEAIPAPDRSADVVVCAQSFHWFDHDVALAEIARVLRPGGRIALVWNFRDESIPWVRRLGDVIGREPRLQPEIQPLEETPHFGWVEDTHYRFWSDLTLPALLDLVRSRSAIAVLDETERAAVLEQVRALYDDYGRGPDGMRLPYLTTCFRAVVRHQEPPTRPAVAAVPEESARDAPHGDGPGGDPTHHQADTPADTPAEAGEPPEDPGTTLIDFR
ncbi:MAG TPA: class I SAM-dependent methyltransferase [Marmoricola sp.]|jgi:ubiquinone/menaquinone biosynthesis C-methylase UbiE|nr:class I SAM-dependent methyltransferase [Marmoricola sp.]